MEQKKEKKEKKKEEYPLKGKKLLLVEDHPMNILVVRKQLEGQKLQVEVAANGQIAVDMFLESAVHYYDLIIMDIRMPVMDGIQAAKIIRSFGREDAKTIPIIAMTANAYEEDKEETHLAGMNEHLVKPVAEKELLRKIEQWIS